jgi:hypothetical protein
VRNLITVFIIFIVFSCCHNNSGNSGNKELRQNISFSKTDSITVDSLMAYCYHSGNRFKGVWVMQGTAFYLSYKQRLYLFSALHNFTGIDPETKKRLNGLPDNPNDIWIWQPFEDRPDWRTYYKSVMKDSLAYSILKDSFRAYFSRPDRGKDYKLYGDKGALFLGESKDALGDNLDIGTLDISDSIPSPRHILDLNKDWNSAVMNVGDTLFYWGYQLEGDHLSVLPNMFVGKIISIPSDDNPYITSDIFSRAGSSGAAVFKISGHRVSLIGVIARGNSEKNIVYISPLKEALGFLKL